MLLGCTLSDDKRYKYVDTDYQDISPEGKVRTKINKVIASKNNAELVNLIT